MKTKIGSMRKPWGYLWALLAVAAATALVIQAPPALGADKNKSLSALNALSDAFTQVSEQASPAVVYIEVEKEVKRGRMPQGFRGNGFPGDFFERFFGQPMPSQPRVPEGKREPYGQGSGFVITPDGYIVTNNHVVSEADGIRVKLKDGRELEAEVVGSDPQTEIALIKVDADGLPTLPLGDSDELKVGEWVLAIGNPFGLTDTVTAGIVSARGRGNVGITDYADFIQTDAAINPGNSGGPLVNLHGEVVGLNTAIYSRSGGYMGIGFAIPVNMVKFVKDQLIENGSITRGFLGVLIQNLTPDLAESFGLEDGIGILIGEVSEDSPASKGGLESGDVIVKFEGQPVEEVGSFRSRIASTPPGEKVRLEIIRDGKRITKRVEIGTLDEQSAVVKSTPSGTQMKMGLTVQNLTDEIAARLGYDEETGVVVTEVENGSAAAAAGLKPGVLIKEVNRKPVQNTREFTKAMKDADPDKPVLLLVQDGEYSRFVALSTED